MPEMTNTARHKFGSMYFSIRKALRINQGLRKIAIQDGDNAKIKKYIKIRKLLTKEFDNLLEVEMEYIVSDKGISESEKALAGAVAEIKKDMSNLKTIAKLLNAAADLTNVLARLAVLLK